MMEVHRIVEQCYNRLPNEWKSHPWDLTEHGRKVLQSETELDTISHNALADAFLAEYTEDLPDIFTGMKLPQEVGKGSSFSLDLQ